MITNIFTNVNDDQPYIAKIEHFLHNHSVVCQSSFSPSDFNKIPNHVTWRVTLTSGSNVQHFDHWQNVSLLPNYNLSPILSIDEQAQQKQLIILATRYGLAIRKFCKPTNEVVRLNRPSVAHIIAGILIKTSAIYCSDYSDWAEKKILNEFNDDNLYEYQDSIRASARFNSLFNFEEQCELSDILIDF